MTTYTHFKNLSAVENLATGAKGSEVPLTASFTEINTACDISAQAALVTPSTVISASAGSVQTSVVQTGNIIKTEIAIDLTGLKSTATTGDVIGNTGVSYIAQITAAINGTIIKGNVSCAVVPTTGDDDIDLYSATEGDVSYDDLITSETETALMTAAAALAIGTDHPLTALPVADAYLYLTTGATTAGTYAAGKIFIELWGTVA